ncbi:hypothetical protein PCANC_22418 [Puccinia coronata f. sp. avenae]|uniref:C2H2-type domain-containing protein n=1 Tax=Puccinia coronata f. sp. avenae TaxID=200324 RepID=A0A2N5SFQ4_9BASI|nr:hypothetical protein PCANC_21946 [Puccinia coronata f. sp. avenae]PLW29137.1 hypothetical protein PCANC_22418 [Puccinia coronata f. sp. avenae]PLW50140.1 hypothetical protein PCASD_01773 [Puccinia coronata f. sp. avenae]
MEFYSSDVLNASSTGINQHPTSSISCPSPPSGLIQLRVTNYHHTTCQIFNETDTLVRAKSDSNATTGGVFQTPNSFQNRPGSSGSILTSSNSGQILGADHQIDNNGLNSAGHCLVANQHRQHYQVTSTEPGQVSQLACKDVTDSTSALQAELDFQFETFPVTSDSISPARLALNLRDHDISNSLLDSHQHPASSAGATTVTSHGNMMDLSSCYVNCSDLSGLQFQSSVVDHALMGFEPTFNYQEHHQSDHEVDEERSNCSPAELSSFSAHQQQAGQENHVQFHTQQQAGWQSFRSNSSALDEDQNQQPLSPEDMAALRSSPPCLAHSSNVYFGSSPLCQYNESASIPPLTVDLSQSPTMLRTGSTASEFSAGSSINSTGVNPIHVNPLSQPVTPQDDIFAPLSDPFHQHWWANQNESHSVESLVTSLRASIGQPLQNSADHEAGARMPSIFAQPLKITTSSPGDRNNSRSSSSPYSIPQRKPPQSPSYQFTPKTRRISHRSSLSNHNRSTSSKVSSRPFLIEPDYSRLPTKRSRGRRPPISPDLGLPIPDGHLSIGLQSVPGGQAFDPNLNPNAETVKYCELTKTGKPKKIFICQVKGCGKCFKRSEHLKRHVRSIHTNDKPYNCPWMACMKSFSRHDNLNQHLRVHRVEEGGEVLNGLHIGSDGVLRSDLDESPVDPVVRGLRDVEVLDRFMIEE